MEVWKMLFLFMFNLSVELIEIFIFFMTLISLGGGQHNFFSLESLPMKAISPRTVSKHLLCSIGSWRSRWDEMRGKTRVFLIITYTPVNEPLEPKKSPNWKERSSEPNLHDFGFKLGVYIMKIWANSQQNPLQEIRPYFQSFRKKVALSKINNWGQALGELGFSWLVLLQRVGAMSMVEILPYVMSLLWVSWAHPLSTEFTSIGHIAIPKCGIVARWCSFGRVSLTHTRRGFHAGGDSNVY